MKAVDTNQKNIHMCIQQNFAVISDVHIDP